ncbi:general stress protein [Paenibacillus piri]|uniref:General stress protein 17M-like domain-containing protein n=1 Tax=Paenibacillus piri TaxID=2547395 RepID=A0A4R5KJ16_9BACL|nr:general stress protein [Paenibacillus piri]TDF95519.1 hypothetical protein E1757_20720 [Paenibacillus piri]
MDNQVKLVTQEEQAIQEIRAFQRQGHKLENIYVLAHDSKMTEGLSKLMNANTVGLKEEGVAGAFANLFRSRGDELRSKMQSLGLSKVEAEHYERALDQGKILVMVWHDNDDYYDRYDRPSNNRRQDEIVIPPSGIYFTDRSV